MRRRDSPGRNRPELHGHPHNHTSTHTGAGRDSRDKHPPTTCCSSSIDSSSNVTCACGRQRGASGEGRHVRWRQGLADSLCLVRVAARAIAALAPHAIGGRRARARAKEEAPPRRAAKRQAACRQRAEEVVEERGRGRTDICDGEDADIVSRQLLGEAVVADTHLACRCRSLQPPLVVTISLPAR